MARILCVVVLNFLVFGITFPFTASAQRLHGPCEFEEENDMCDLEGRHNFHIRSGRPSSDHNAMDSGYTGAGYLLLEEYNTINTIMTPSLKHGEGAVEVHFAYYISGGNDGQSYLGVFQELDSGKVDIRWETTAHKRHWNYINVTLDIPEGASFKVKLTAEAYHSDWNDETTWLGIDSLEVVEGGVVSSCSLPSTMQFAEPWICSAPGDELPEGTVCETFCKPGFSAQGDLRITCVEEEWQQDDAQGVSACLDTQGPQFTCPENQEVVTPYGWGSLWYTINQPQVTDNTGSFDILLFIDGVAEPSTNLTTTLSTGTYTVVFLATDSFGNQNSCTYTITVTAADQTPPTVVSCPAPQTIETDVPVMVAWPEPVFTDDTGYIDMVESNYETGSVFIWGIHEINYTAYDNSSNAASCIFPVIVWGLPCPTLQPAVFGALVCHESYAGSFCVSMCGPEGDFNVPSPDLQVPTDYLCSTSGFWYPYGFTYNCLDPYGDETTMTSDYYYHSQCNETDTQLAMKQQALTIFNVADTDITLGQELQPEDFYVLCGPDEH